MEYNPVVIYTTCGAKVLLKFVESFTFGRDSEDELVNKLKDDLCFSIRTISGKEYEISTKLIAEKIGGGDSFQQIAQAIDMRWHRINGGN